jgi:hypothetical protein
MSFSKDSNQPSNTYVDLLDEDKVIAGQKFTCISFLSPDTILKKKEMFFFEEFLKKWDFLKSMEKFQQFLHFISYKYKMNYETITKDLESFVQEEKSNLLKTTIDDEFKNFLDQSEEELENAFNTKYNFQTNVRGIKVRGSYGTQEEAELRCKLIRETDPHHDVYVGPVGVWMPWEPEAYKTGRVEYLEKELNELMHQKKTNENNAKVEFDKRVREAKEKAMEDNRESAMKTGNPLTQIMNNEGELVNVRNIDLDSISDESIVMPKDGTNNNKVSSVDIRRELFENENINVPISPVASPSANSLQKTLSREIMKELSNTDQNED